MNKEMVINEVKKWRGIMGNTVEGFEKDVVWLAEGMIFMFYLNRKFIFSVCSDRMLQTVVTSEINEEVYQLDNGLAITWNGGL